MLRFLCENGKQFDLELGKTAQEGAEDCMKPYG